MRRPSEGSCEYRALCPVDACMKEALQRAIRAAASEGEAWWFSRVAATEVQQGVQFLHRVGWTPREQNEETDAPTNKEFAGFDPARRIAVDVAALPFVVLPSLVRAAGVLYDEVQARRSAGRSRRPQRPGGPRRA